jgi:membrane protein DedA with SNARE-associated domain
MIMELLAFSFDQIQGWIQAGGYLMLFGLLFACGLGLPLPEDIPLIIAGALIAKGQMTWTIAAAAAWLGIVGGDIFLYWMARRYGMNITKAPLIGKHVTRERIEWVEGLFEKYGVGVVAVCRLFAGIRGAMVIAAGTIRFNFAKFVIVDGIAALISGGLFMLFGWWVGNKLTRELVHEFKEWFMVGGIVLAIALVAWIIWRRRHPGVHPVENVEMKVVEKVVAATHHDSHRKERLHVDAPRGEA